MGFLSTIRKKSRLKWLPKKSSGCSSASPANRSNTLLFTVPHPKKCSNRYTALTGRPALPPAWSFGLWLSTSFTTNYDEETVTGFIR